MEGTRTGLLSGSALKRTAIGSMLLDHTGYVLVWQAYLAALGTGAAEGWYALYVLLRLAGRLAFPIFCFLLTEGFFHTRSRGRYALRLGLFALVSEVPFDLAFRGTLWAADYQNVFFTLLLGLLALWAWDGLSRRLPPAPAWALGLAAAALCGLAAEGLETDYGAFGVALIFNLGVCRALTAPRDGIAHALLPAAVGALTVLGYCVLEDNWIECAALFGLVLTLLYSGARGRGGKWGFYLFYPLHLLALVALLGWML